tara:strand:+ start:1031 stop:1291 length:261 start_codon:yes stop_codon:yes gene_type:complete
MKRKKIDKIYYEMFVTNSLEEDKGKIGEVVYVNDKDRIAYIQWFRGECDTFTFDWIQRHYYELIDDEEELDDEVKHYALDKALEAL